MGLRLLPEAVRWNFNLGLRGAKCAVSVPDLGGGAERRRGGENGVFPVCLGRHGPPERVIERYPHVDDLVKYNIYISWRSREIFWAIPCISCLSRRTR